MKRFQGWIALNLCLTLLLTYCLSKKVFDRAERLTWPVALTCNWPLGNWPQCFSRYLTLLRQNSIHFQFQIIIAASWICPLVLDFPMLLVTDFHKKKGHNFCTHAWPEKWMSQAYTSTWRVYLGLSFTLLVVFYSRVVYCLWFKRNDDNVLTEQQKVFSKFLIKCWNNFYIIFIYNFLP